MLARHIRYSDHDCCTNAQLTHCASPLAGQKPEETESLKVVTNKAAAETLASRPAEADALADTLRGGDAPAPSVPASAASSAPADDADSLAGIHVDVDSMRQLALQCDEAVRIVSIAPWMRAAGGERARIENDAIASQMEVLSTAVPNFSTIVNRVWAGEKDEAALAADATTHERDPVSRAVARCLVKQLLLCAEALDRAAGPPDAERPKARHSLIRSIKDVAVLKEWVVANEASWRRALEADK